MSPSTESERGRRRSWVWGVIGLVVAIVAGAGLAYALVHQTSTSGTSGGAHRAPPSSSSSPTSPTAESQPTTPTTPSTAGSHPTTSTTTSPKATSTTTRPVVKLTVASVSPRSGAVGVQPNSTVRVRLSTAVSLGSIRPTISPAVAGAWRQVAPTVVQFTPMRSFVPYTSETVTIPGGRQGLGAADGSHLSSSVTIHFAIAAGSTLRLQQLLAELHYLPLSFTPRGPSRVSRDTALPQRGTFSWRWSQTSSQLTALWERGAYNVITKGAVMAFEKQAGLSVDGVAGPAVWGALLADKAANRMDASPYTYVLVSKTLPEHLTLWDDGAVKFSNVPVNTGLPGAQTTDGTYPVFEHVVASEMKGTNPNGSTYDDKGVPWASYFNHGEALHGFVRAEYGFPQSNGCVEMEVSNAGELWPYTPIGTLVTVIGPDAT
jgi:peptidoglycan hydrolase-like protein with peptidoglycan-binding domain